MVSAEARAAAFMHEPRPGIVMRWIQLLSSVPLGMAVALQAFAGSADIEGTVSYQISGDRVTVEIERIANNTSNLTTDTLYLTVRMTEGSSVSGSGHNVARYQFTGSSNGQLGPGQFFSNIRFTLDYTRPPPGTYYVHIWTSQHPDDNTVLDSITFAERLTVSDVGGSADIEGSISYRPHREQHQQSHDGHALPDCSHDGGTERFRFRSQRRAPPVHGVQQRPVGTWTILFEHKRDP